MYIKEALPEGVDVPRVDEFIRVCELDLLDESPNEVPPRQDTLNQDQHVGVYLKGKGSVNYLCNPPVKQNN